MELDLENLTFEKLPPEIKALFDEKTKGLKDNKDNILAQLAEEKDKTATLQAELDAKKIALESLTDKLGKENIEEVVNVYNEFKDYEPDQEEQKMRESIKTSLERNYVPQIDSLTVKLENAERDLAEYKEREFINKSVTPIHNAVRPLEKIIQTIALPLLKEQWKYDPKYDRPVGKDLQGRMITNDNGDPLSIDEYIDGDRFKEDFPNLFAKAEKPTFGAISTNSKLRDIDINPWKKETLNRTLQARIRKEDPAEAARLMKAAGYVSRSVMS